MNNKNMLEQNNSQQLFPDQQAANNIEEQQTNPQNISQHLKNQQKQQQDTPKEITDTADNQTQLKQLAFEHQNGTAKLNTKISIDSEQSVERVQSVGFKEQVGSRPILEVEEEDHENTGYKALTNKLQFALRKISSSQNISKQSLTSSHKIIRRFEECEIKRMRNIHEIKEEVEKKQIKQVKQKPLINKNSDKIARQMGYEPIHKRYVKIVEQKIKKREQNEQSKKKKEEEEGQKFLQQFKKHVKKPQNTRTYDEYYEQMIKWKEKHFEESNQKAHLKQCKTLEGHTFKPQIDHKSKKMAQSKNRTPIEERGLVRKKISALYSFAPKINKRKIDL